MNNNDEAVIIAMEKYGSNFVRKIAALYWAAEETTRAKIKAMFPEYWVRYLSVAKEMGIIVPRIDMEEQKSLGKILQRACKSIGMESDGQFHKVSFVISALVRMNDNDFHFGDLELKNNIKLKEITGDCSTKYHNRCLENSDTCGCECHNK